MKYIFFLVSLFSFQICFAQPKDTSILINETVVTLPEVILRNNTDYAKILKQIKQDTSFYKAFKNLRILSYTSYNDIKIFDRKQRVKASLFSKTKQVRVNNCRTMQVLEEQSIGDFYNDKKEMNYETAKLYAGLFFTNGIVCNETNIVQGTEFSTNNKKGIEKSKEQLKMLFFNPGKKIPGIPFIGNKLDLYDEKARALYDYKMDIVTFENKSCYVFYITPKETLTDDEKSDIVVDKMTTWFDYETMEVVGRNYSLSYKAGVYDFDVSMEVIMQKVKGYTIPRVMRYIGNWDVIFKKRERASFTATVFDVQ
jgi:hypothetical protein